MGYYSDNYEGYGKEFCGFLPPLQYEGTGNGKTSDSVVFPCVRIKEKIGIDIDAIGGDPEPSSQVGQSFSDPPFENREHVFIYDSFSDPADTPVNGTYPNNGYFTPFINGDGNGCRYPLGGTRNYIPHK